MPVRTHHQSGVLFLAEQDALAVAALSLSREVGGVIAAYLLMLPAHAATRRRPTAAREEPAREAAAAVARGPTEEVLGMCPLHGCRSVMGWILLCLQQSFQRNPDSSGVSVWNQLSI
mmetsp:Transcript_10378/g.23453  ORF Transcript_10378/g.23453 Transcript_10378/m.23453 type:complete len:117 (+) Transcript_10378:286-636(+)